MKIIGCLIIMLFATGCRELLNFPKDTLVRIQNDSDFDLKIMAFKKNKIIFPEFNRDTIYLNKGKYIEKTLAPKYSGLPYFESDTDSIVIIFNSKKILIQACNGEILYLLPSINKCNITNNLNGAGDNRNVEEFNSRKYEKLITYKITQSDYDRAVNF